MNLSQENHTNVMAQAIINTFDDPDWFASEILQCPNDPWQSDFCNALLDVERKRLGIETRINHEGLNRISIRSCHGTGKTHVFAKAMHMWNFLDEGLIPCTAPKYNQLITRLFPEFRRIRKGALPYYQELIKVDTTKIQWAGDPDWCAIAESSSEPENLAGYHHKRILFLVDEASGRRLDAMFPTIQGALTTEGAILAMIGNPTRTSGYFFESHRKSGTKEKFFLMHISPDNAPRIDKQWVKDMADMYGEDSPVYKVRVLGEFADMEANQLIALEWLVDAEQQEEFEDGSLPRLRITADIADGGIDSSVFEVAKHYDSAQHKLKQVKKNYPSGKSVTLCADMIQSLWEAYDGNVANGDDIIVDGLGVGAGVVSELLKRNLPVVRYVGGEKSDDPERWRNRRTQSYMVFRNDLRDAKVIYHPDFTDNWDNYWAQCCSIKTRDTNERLEDLETKESMKKSGLKSPDESDASAMQNSTQQPMEPMTEFEFQGYGEMETANADW